MHATSPREGSPRNHGAGFQVGLGFWFSIGILPFIFPRMRSRRVPVLRLGSRGPEGDKRSLRLWTQAFASVRKRPQAFRKRSQASAGVRGGSDMPDRRKSSRNAELSSLWTRLRVSKVSTVTRIGGVLVAKPRTVVTFGFVLRLRVSKVSTVTGIGGVLVAKPRTVVTFGFVLRLRVSKVSTVTGIGGVLVAKPRTVVTFGLVSRLRVSKVSTVTGIGGGPGRETQNCRHFWTRLASSRLKSVNSHRDRGGPGREAQNCRHFWTRRWREERREERGKKRDERREERREEESG